MRLEEAEASSVDNGLGENIGSEIEHHIYMLFFELKEMEERDALRSWVRAAWIDSFCPQDLAFEADEILRARLDGKISEEEAVESLNGLIGLCAERFGEERLVRILNCLNEENIAYICYNIRFMSE